jgi:hypothetical protein
MPLDDHITHPFEGHTIPSVPSELKRLTILALLMAKAEDTRLVGGQ